MTKRRCVEQLRLGKFTAPVSGRHHGNEILNGILNESRSRVNSVQIKQHRNPHMKSTFTHQCFGPYPLHSLVVPSTTDWGSCNVMMNTYTCICIQLGMETHGLVGANMLVSSGTLIPRAEKTPWSAEKASWNDISKRWPTSYIIPLTAVWVSLLYSFIFNIHMAAFLWMIWLLFGGRSSSMEQFPPGSSKLSSCPPCPSESVEVLRMVWWWWFF